MQTIDHSHYLRNITHDDLHPIKWIAIRDVASTLQGTMVPTYPFTRLPLTDDFRSELIVLAKQPAGIYVEFTTSSTQILLKASVLQKARFPHMSPTAEIGFDLYQQINNTWVFHQTSKCNEKDYISLLATYNDAITRRFRLYFPLYMEVKELSLGILKAETIAFHTEFLPALVCYGTSITQGACASRAGMAYPAILGRLLPFHVYNLGFSGNAKLDISIATSICNIPNCSIIVLEVEANNDNTYDLKQHLPTFIHLLKTHPSNPKIVLISHFPNPKALVDPMLMEHYNEARTFQQQLSHKENIHFVDGWNLLQDLMFEETVDQSHLTDLGFYFLATKLQKILLSL